MYEEECRYEDLVIFIERIFEKLRDDRIILFQFSRISPSISEIEDDNLYAKVSLYEGVTCPYARVIFFFCVSNLQKFLSKNFHFSISISEISPYFIASLFEFVC